MHRMRRCVFFDMWRELLGRLLRMLRGLLKELFEQLHDGLLWRVLQHLQRELHDNVFRRLRHDMHNTMLRKLHRHCYVSTGGLSL